MNKTIGKKTYVIPLVEVLSARVEHGFELSIVDPHEELNGQAVRGGGWTQGSTTYWFT